jgi:hypothetical protein
MGCAQRAGLFTGAIFSDCQNIFTPLEDGSTSAAGGSNVEGINVFD